MQPRGLTQPSCETELRLCFQNDEPDSTVQDGLMSWHSLCDDYVTFQVTSPVLTQLTTSVNDDFCETIVRGACDRAHLSLGSCSAIIADSTAFNSCVCSPPLLLLEYTCEFLGSTSCLHAGATLSNLVAYPSCSNLAEVVSAAAVSGCLVPPAPGLLDVEGKPNVQADCWSNRDADAAT